MYGMVRLVSVNSIYIIIIYIIIYYYIYYKIGIRKIERCLMSLCHCHFVIFAYSLAVVDEP